MQISRGGSRLLEIKEGRMSVETKQMHMLENRWEGAKLNRIHSENSNTGRNQNRAQILFITHLVPYWYCFVYLRNSSLAY